MSKLLGEALDKIRNNVAFSVLVFSVTVMPWIICLLAMMVGSTLPALPVILSGQTIVLAIASFIYWLEAHDGKIK